MHDFPPKSILSSRRFGTLYAQRALRTIWRKILTSEILGEREINFYVMDYMVSTAQLMSRSQGCGIGGGVIGGCSRVRSVV